jgi:hypothetical protein
MTKLPRRALIAAGTTALAAAAFAAPGSAQAAPPADAPLCFKITVTDLVNTADQLCQGGSKDTR